jgi:uncharacterized protein
VNAVLAEPAMTPATTSAATSAATPSASALDAELDARGAAVIPALLNDEQCAQLIDCYANAETFRSRVIMQRHGFGRGEYQYFHYPLPALVQALRTRLYESLAPIANRWGSLLKRAARYPPTLAEYLEQCHAAGQIRPTPLLLRYEAGDYNCLHQDLYGEQVFPLQATVLLSAPGEDFEGGEFVLTEQRPRAQSRAEVVPLRRGDAVVFAVHHRPAQGTRGIYRVSMRHGVSRLRQGMRYTLGVIFHDAKS